MLQTALEVWLPLFDPAASREATRRDIARAQRLRDLETIVWVIPGLEKEFRWAHHAAAWSYLAMPGEQANRFDIVYIGKNETVAESPDSGRFLSVDARQLLVDWLRAGSTDAERIALHPGRSQVLVEFPRQIVGDRVEFAHREFILGPTNLLDTSADVDRGGITMTWPGADFDKKYEIISPDNEGGVRSEDWEPAVIDGIPHWRNRNDPTRTSFNFENRWPGNLQNLYPLGSGLDSFYAREQMLEAVDKSQTDLEEALQFAHAKGSGQIHRGSAPVFASWYLPELRKRGQEGILMELEGRHGIAVEDFFQLHLDPGFHELVGRASPVSRCLGVPAMFWALLIDRLEQGSPHRVCLECGRIISGPRHKKHCSKKDNEDCWKRRVRKRKRQSRKRAGRK